MKIPVFDSTSEYSSAPSINYILLVNYN